MDVLKIVAEGITTSFRYPHFALTVQPSFTLPPPATIYGHICSAVGEWIDPASVEFAYHFSFAGEAEDLEYIHAVSPSSGKLPSTNLPKVLEGAVQPFQRKILFKPCLTLYINRLDLYTAFRQPRYAVSLGRSQDLMMYRSVEQVKLEQRHDIYFENTLLPYLMATRIRVGTVTMMPRMLDYYQDRQPIWGRYLLLNRHVPHTALMNHDDDNYWADPTELDVNQFARALVFHRFVED